MNSSSTIDVKMLMEIAEMKRIYAALEPCLLKTTPYCLTVTSAMLGEGKTTVVAGIAAATATQFNKRVLVMDLNWRSPAINSYFGVDLIDAEKFTKIESISGLVTHSNTVANLDVLPSIKPGTNRDGNPLDETALAVKMIEQARNEYDVIFIDTSAIFPTNRRMMDPVTIAKTSDGAVLMVLANKTSRQQVKRARIILETADVNILGVIVNQWKNPIAWTISLSFAG